MPGPKKGHNEQIEQVRKEWQKSNPPFQPVDYMGLRLDNKLADQLKEQPASELLSFEKMGDQTRIQAKMPEKGFDKRTGKEFNIRVNMNYFTRGIVRASLDENGNFDMKKGEQLAELRDELFSASSNLKYKPGDKMYDKEAVEAYPKLKQQFIEKLDIPLEDREDFDRFFSNCLEQQGNVIVSDNYSPILFMNAEASKIAGFQYLEAGNEMSERVAKKTDDQIGRMIDDMRPHQENLCENFRLMAEMDPKTEKRILHPSDCDAFKQLMSGLVRQHNDWREHKGLKPLDVRGKDINFTGQNEDPDANMNRYFDEHHLLAVPMELDGKEVFLSLENTAPPAGSPLERPAVERTGVGLFESEKQIEDFHFSVNLGPFAHSIGNCNSLDKTGTELADAGGVMAIKTWATEANRERELMKTCKDSEVSDHFARFIAARFIANTPGKDRPPLTEQTLNSRAATLKKDNEFRALMRTCTPDKMRETMSAKNPLNAAVTLYRPDPAQRYSVNEASVKQLQELGASMGTKGRSKEWKELKEALSDRQMKDTQKIMEAVEHYTKGKMKVRMTKKGRDSFDLAMKALAIVAKNGNEVAKARADILVERINEVRGATQPHSKNRVELKEYEPKREAPEREINQPTRGSEPQRG